MDEARFRAAEQRVWSSRGVTPVERWGALPTGERLRAQFVGDGPPVLFVHGTTVSGTSWVDLAVRLPGHQCILIDRPGCGLSDPYVAPSTDLDDVETRADRLVADVLDAFGIERAHVAGTSYGGYFVLRGAARHLDRVDHLIEFSWPVGAALADVPFVLRVLAIPGLDRLAARMKPTRGMARRALRQMGLAGAIDSGRFTDDMLDWYLSVVRDTDSMVNEMRSSPRLVSPIAGFHDDVLLGADLLARVRAPSLFVWGDDDPNGGGDIARAFTRRLPAAELRVLPDAGHAPWIDEPDRCARLVDEFLRAN